MKIEEQNLDNPQKPQLNIPAVSGSFLSNLEHRMNEILFSGLDITILKFNQDDAIKFKSELKEVSGINISSVKTYKGIAIRKTKGKSKLSQWINLEIITVGTLICLLVKSYSKIIANGCKYKAFINRNLN